MTTTEKSCSTRNVDLGLLLLRISLSVLLLFHGFSHLFGGLDGMKGILAAAGIPGFVAYGSLLGEVVAPLLIIVGLRTRVAAFIMAGNMLVAILTAHFGELCQLSPYGGWAVELPALYLFGACALVLTGAGRFALSSRHCLD